MNFIKLVEQTTEKRKNYINKKLGELNENEKEFIRLENEYEYTNMFRFQSLVQFLKLCRVQEKEFKPILIFGPSSHTLKKEYKENNYKLLDDIYRSSELFDELGLVHNSVVRHFKNMVYYSIV